MRVFILIVLAYFLIGCQSSWRQGFRLVEAGALNNTVTVWQILKLTTGNGAQVYNAVLDVSEQTTQLILFSPLGHRMATAISTNGTLSFEKSVPFKLAMAADELLLVMQLCYWPADILRDALQSSDLVLVDGVNGREIYKDENKLASVTYRAGEGWNRTFYFESSDGKQLLIESKRI